MAFRQDFLEESKLNGERILDQVTSDRIEWSYIHVSVRVEVVDELYLIHVLEDKIAHRLCLRL